MLSFYEYTLYTPELTQFVGLRNYVSVISDTLFLLALKNALIWTVLSMIFQVFLGLALALLLYQSFKGKRIFQVITLLPFALPPVALAVAWKWLYDPIYGVINYFITAFLGVKPINFFSKDLALYSVTLVNIWKAFPFYALFFLAGLASIPNEIFESALIDGAGTFSRLRYITLPLLKDLIIVLSIFSAIWTFNYFDLIYAMTHGGPAHATEILATLAYRYIFYQLRFDYAAATSVIMLLINAMLVACIILIGRGGKK